MLHAIHLLPLDIPALVMIRDLKKTYQSSSAKTPVLHGVSLQIQRGDFVAIMGPSGSGKTTLMNILGCLDRPTAGEYWLAGKLVSRAGPDELAHMRNQFIGFVFQGFNLLPRVSALKNVALPLIYAGLPKEVREQRARHALQLVGLGERVYHTPTQLSGGQQQRVAIARALVTFPALLLADEPTGNLDPHTSREIMALLQSLNQRGLTIVLVTHDADSAAYAKRQIIIRSGRIVHNELTPLRHATAHDIAETTPQRQRNLSSTPSGSAAR